MTHYSAGQYIDYARGLCPTTETTIMRQHLENCAKCFRLALQFENALQLAASDRAFTPPAELVAAAEDIFTPAHARNLKGLGSRLRSLAAVLEWDSFTDSMAEGVRSLRPDSRHMVYRAGRYSVDVLVEIDSESGGITVTGQVADDTNPTCMVGATRPVLLLSGEDVLSGTKSSKWGEFSLQSRGKRNLALWIPVEQTGECIELAIPDSDLSVLEMNA